MKKRLSLAALLLSMAAQVWAWNLGDFRAPVTVVERAYMHFDLDPVCETWWYDAMDNFEHKDCCEPGNWRVESWMALFQRVAGKAFMKFDECNGVETVSSKSTSRTTSLSTLIFGEPTFKVSEGFAGGGIDATLTEEVTAGDGSTATLYPDLELLNDVNPLLNVFRITPNFDYNEKGAVWGMRAEYRFECAECWYMGGIVSLPFKVIEVRQDDKCTFEETFDDIARVVPITVQSTTSGAGAPVVQEDVTVRLDFASSVIFRNQQYISDTYAQFPYISYGDGTNNTLVFATIADGPSGDAVPVLLQRESSGNVFDVPYPFRKIVVSDDPNFPAVSTIPLAANGTNGSNGAVLFFEEGVDYASGIGSDNKAQTELFVVFPTDNVLTTDPSTADSIKSTAANMYSVILQVLRDLELGGNSPVDFLCQKGLDLHAYERTIGAGDMDFTLYGGYGHRWDWYAELQLGFRAPTGTKQKNPYQVYRFETGNNKHWELMVGLEGGWRPTDWFAFKIDFDYHHAFARDQKILATFEGSTVKNLGPAVNGKVWWNYFTFHTDLNFFHPCNPDLGAMVGYELFAKRKDHVEFCQTEAEDFLGRTGTLDPTVAEEHSNAMLHKIIGELFNRWNYIEIIMGASTAVGGHFSMKETEAHIALNVYF